MRVIVREKFSVGAGRVISPGGISSVVQAGLFYSEEIATGICHELNPRAEVIWGTQEDHSIPEGEVRVFALVFTGQKEG